MDHLRTVPVPSSLDAALLYELSLSAGTSLELVANCQTFLRALLGRLGFDFGAVWLRSRYLTQGHRPEGYALVAAMPEAYIREIHLPETHPLFEGLGDRTAWVVPSAHEAFKACVTEFGIKRGTYAVHLLGTFGFLKLYARPTRPAVDESALLALKRVLRYFTDSIERSLAYQYQLDEVDEHVQTERRLRLTLARLVALIGSLTTGVLLEDESLEVVLANEAFCKLLGLPDTPQALIGLRRHRLIQRLRDRLADPAEALWQLGTLADRQRPATGLRVQAADDSHRLRACHPRRLQWPSLAVPAGGRCPALPHRVHSQCRRSLPRLQPLSTGYAIRHRPGRPLRPERPGAPNPGDPARGGCAPCCRDRAVSQSSAS